MLPFIFFVYSAVLPNLDIPKVNYAFDQEIRGIERDNYNLKNMDKGVVLFVASWCPVCKDLIPKIDHLDLVMIFVDDDFETARTFVKNNNLKGKAYYSKELAVNFKIEAIPKIFFKYENSFFDYSKNNPESVWDMWNYFQISKNEERKIDLKLEASAPKRIKKGKVFTLFLEVDLTSYNNTYIFKEPEINPTENIEIKNIRSKSANNKLTYEIDLVVNEKGTIKIGPIDLPYRVLSGETAVIRNSGLSIEVVGLNIILVVIIFIGCLGTAVVIYLLKFKITKKTLVVMDHDYLKEWEILEKSSLDFLDKEYQFKLVSLYSKVVEKIDLDAFKYGNKILTNLEIDFYRKAIMRILKEKE